MTQSMAREKMVMECLSLCQTPHTTTRSMASPPEKGKKRKKKNLSRTDCPPKKAEKRKKKEKKTSQTDTGPRFCQNYTGKGQPTGKGPKKKKKTISAIKNICGRFRHRKRCQNCHVTDRWTNAINSIDWQKLLQ